MFRARTFIIFLFIMLAVLGLIALAPQMHWDSVALMPLLSVYFFHAMGVPGLVESGNSAAGMWPMPTPLGYIFTASVWLLGAWMIAMVIEKLFRRKPNH